MVRGNQKLGSRLVIIMVTLLMLCVSPLSAFAAKDEKTTVVKGVSIKLDGEKVKVSDPIRKQGERIYVSVSSIAGIVGAKSKWDKANEETTINTALGDKIVLGNEVPVVYFNDERYVLDEVPFLVDGKMYMPLREMAELFHATAKWNKEENVVELTMVKQAVVTAEYGLAEISKKYGISKSELLKRNGLDSKDTIKEGTKLLVVVPSIYDHEAKPYTDEDMNLLAKITQVESGNESYEGQLGVANVILNRVKDSRFPDSIKGVIYSGKQFPPAHNGMLDKSKPNASVLRAAKDALNGKNNVGDAVYFFNPKVSKGSFWSSLDVIVTIGHHSFAK